MSASHAHCALPWIPKASAAREFLRSCGDIFGASEHAFLFLPPMAVVCATLPLGVQRVVQDPKVIDDPADLLRMVHLEEEIVWHGPIELERPLWVSARLVARKQLRGGQTLKIATEMSDSVGVLRVASCSTVFIRQGEVRPPVVAQVRTAELPSAVPQNALRWHVAPDQPERYAAASGEFNPIHLDDAAAQQAGLEGRILHGMCTMGFAAQCLVATCLAGDGRRLRRFKARFGQPVYPNSTLWCTLGTQEAGTIGVQVLHTDGRKALTRGEAEVSP